MLKVKLIDSTFKNFTFILSFTESTTTLPITFSTGIEGPVNPVFHKNAIEVDLDPSFNPPTGPMTREMTPEIMKPSLSLSNTSEKAMKTVDESTIFELEVSIPEVLNSLESERTKESHEDKTQRPYQDYHGENKRILFFRFLRLNQSIEI